MTTAAAPPASAFQIEEAAAARPSALDADGTCLIHVIRPGRGLGRGGHYYPAKMLQENASVFTGWPVYIDHESPKAKQARGHLPRSLRDIGGLLEEAWWDDSVPAEGRFGQGAVVARLRPIGDLEQIIAKLPQAARFSIKAQATDVEEGVPDGEHAWIVEGIRDDVPGSVDAVTLDGAGGKVAELIEGLHLEESAVEDELAQARSRAAKNKDAARRHDERPEAGEGGDSVKELEEALADPESPVAKRVMELVESRATELVESAVETAVSEARQEERDKAARSRELRDMRDEAHKLIEAAELPDRTTARLKSRWGLDGEEPTDALDLVDQIDSEGNVTKSAMTQLTEAVSQEVEDEKLALQEALAEADPTRVEGQGAARPDDETPEGGEQPRQGRKRFWREHLEESGIDPDEAFKDRPELQLAEAAATPGEKE